MISIFIALMCNNVILLELVPTASITPEDAKRKAEMLVASGVRLKKSDSEM